MSMLLFMPWCKIDKVYEVGDIRIVPFERHKPIVDLDDAAQCRVNVIMGIYKTIEGNPVENAALVQYDGKSPIDDLTEKEIDIAYDLVTLACFSGLAQREYFNFLVRYCNSDCFGLLAQKFDNADSIVISTRRREGQDGSRGVWSIDKISITVPVHVHMIRKVSLDARLLNALVAFRSNENNNWDKWQNAISHFNWANTDSNTVRYQSEWVFLCSAFQQLLGADSNANDMACKFSNILKPRKSVTAKDATQGPKEQSNHDKPLRYVWMREFYRLRGDFAHGKLATQQHFSWDELKHLVLATIAFPLVIKSLLVEEEVYELTRDDRIDIDCLELLADTPDFLHPQMNSKGNQYWHWTRIRKERSRELAPEEIKEALKQGIGGVAGVERSEPPEI